MTVQTIKNAHGLKLAYHKTDGNADLPGVMFLGGFMSDMEGSKATALENLCKARGRGYVRFDYSGHGRSEGEFIAGTISGWLEDALTIFDVLTTGPQILVGSSMGGWIALLLALKRPARVCGIVGIAAAPDFAGELYDLYLSEAQRRDIDENGLTYQPSDYDAPYPITGTLIEDGRKQALLHAPINISCPVRLLQGTDDTIVAADKPYRIKERLITKDVEITLIEGGDHSLSRPQDIALIDRKIRELSE